MDSFNVVVVITSNHAVMKLACMICILVDNYQLDPSLLRSLSRRYLIGWVEHQRHQHPVAAIADRLCGAGADPVRGYDR